MGTKYETDVSTESDAPFSKMQVTIDSQTHLITSVDQV